MYCMKCGSPNSESARFCIKCGTPLAQAETTRPHPLSQAVRPESGRPRTEKPERRRRLPRWLVILAVALLALVLLCGAALVGAYFWLGLHRTNQTAKIVPAGTPLMISLSPDPRQALQYREVENLQALLPMFGAVPELRETSEETLSDLKTEFGIDFREDVLPWIGGEVSVAMMDTKPAGYGDVPPIILAVATHSEKKSDAFLEKVWQAMEQGGASFEEEVYHDTQVTYQVPDYEGAFAPAFATFKHLVVVGSNLDALHQAIDTAQNGQAQVLADQETYQAVIQALPANRLGYVYLDGESLLRDLDAETDLPLDTQAIQGIGFSFGLVADGLHFEYVANYDPDLLSVAQREAMQRPANRLKTSKLVSEEAVAYLSDQDPSLLLFLGDFLVGLSNAYEYYYALDTGDERAEAVQESTGIRLKDDVLGQLDGEWSIAVLPDPTGLLGGEEIPLGVILFAEIQDPRKLQDTLDELVGTMEDEGALLSRTEIDGVESTIVEGSWDPWVFGYGFVDDMVVVGTSEAMLRLAIQGRDNALADEKTFQGVLKELPDKAGSYFFVDVSQATGLVYDMMDEWAREDFDSSVRPYLESIEAIGIGASPVDKKGVAHGTLFIYLAEK